MTEQIDQFIDLIPRTKWRWEENYVSPYGSAYERAKTNFEAKVHEIHDRNKMVASLLMVGLTVASGSVLTALFANEKLRTALVEGALKVVCDNNMNRSFGIMSMVSSNKVAKFALGAAWDRTAGVLQFQAINQVNAIRLPNITEPRHLIGPVEMQNNLNSVVTTAADMLITAAHTLRNDSTKSDEEKNRGLAVLQAAPFQRVPTKPQVAELADRIELGFYLSMIVASDYTQRTESRYDGMHYRHERMGARSYVTESTTDTNYPQAAFRERQANGSYHSHRTYYDNLDIAFQRRVNELASRPIYDIGRFSIMGERGERDHLVDAERELARLGDRTLTLLERSAG